MATKVDAAVGAAGAAGGNGAADAKADYSGMSSLDILNLPAQAGAPDAPKAPETADTKPGDAVAGKPDGTAGAAGEQGKPVASLEDVLAEMDPTAAPAWLKPLLADEKTKAEAQAHWDKHNAYGKAFETPEEAAKVRELLPGGAEQLTQVLAKVKEFEDDDGALYSRDPEKQGELAERLAESDPEAFVSMAKVSLPMVAQLDPEGYNEIAREMLQATVGQKLGEIRKAIKEGSEEEAGEKIAQFLQWAEKGGLLVDPRQALKGRGSEREAAAAHQREQLAQQYGEWTKTIKSDVDGRIDVQVKGIFERALPAGLNEAMRTRMMGEIRSEVEKRLGKNEWLTQQLANLAQGPKGLRLDAETQKQAAELIFRHVKPLVVPAVREVVNAWTGAQVGKAQETAAKTDAAQVKKEVPSGAAPAGGKPQVDAKEIIALGRAATSSMEYLTELEKRGL